MRTGETTKVSLPARIRDVMFGGPRGDDFLKDVDCGDGGGVNLTRESKVVNELDTEDHHFHKHTCLASSTDFSSTHRTFHRHLEYHQPLHNQKVTKMRT